MQLQQSRRHTIPPAAQTPRQVGVSRVFGAVSEGVAQALTCLFMLLDCAVLIAIILGLLLVQAAHRARLDWHGKQGLSFLQLGLRELARLCYEGMPLPKLLALPKHNLPLAAAAHRKREVLDCRIASKVTKFSLGDCLRFPHH